MRFDGRETATVGGATRWAGALAALTVLSFVATARAVDFGAKGEWPTTTGTLPSADLLVYPTGSGTYPWVFVAHDDAAPAADLVALGQHLASYGVVAVIPELCSPPGSCVPSVSSVSSKIASARAQLSSTLFPVKVNTQKLALVGHGTGAYFIADAEVAGVTTRVLLDPVHALSTPLGPSQVMAKQSAAVLSLFAPANGCNAQGVWAPFATKTKPGVKALAATVAGASHCDAAPEWLGCTKKCAQTGPTSPERVAKFRGLTTAWLLAYLADVPQAMCAVTPSALGADPSLTNVAATFELPPCGGGGQGGSAGSGGAGAKAGSGGKGGAGGAGGAGAKSGAGPAGKEGAGGAAAKAGAAGASVGGGTNAGLAGAASADDGRGEYFELGQLEHEGLGDAESAPVCSIRAARAGGLGCLAPLAAGLAFALRRRARGQV